MIKKRRGHNPKRKLASADCWSSDKRQAQAELARYGGNPEHKTRPGDYGLNPPASPRPMKTLCDARRPFLKKEAETLLKEGIKRGMISHIGTEAWPKHVWAVSDEQEVFEAQLENSDQGVYHGYPLPLDDDFRGVVLSEWQKR